LDEVDTTFVPSINLDQCYCIEAEVCIDRHGWLKFSWLHIYPYQITYQMCLALDITRKIKLFLKWYTLCTTLIHVCCVLLLRTYIN